tara:strand:- start:149 stop:424 length:276 start_codon:yes stop_codon:yes gene_type:complete
MKLTTKRLKQLIREEMENVIETMTSEKSGVEKVRDTDTGEIIMIDHKNKIITVLNKDGSKSDTKIVYDPDFVESAAPFKNYVKIEESRFNQ